MALNDKKTKKQGEQAQNRTAATTSGKKSQAVPGLPGKARKAGSVQKSSPGSIQAKETTANTPSKTISNVLGEITWLMTQSPNHRYFFLSDLEWMILPPVSQGQFRVFHGEKFPVGVAFWAFVSQEVEERIRKGITKMRPGDWSSGDKLWLVDLISPFGNAQKMVEDLVKNVFPDKPFKYLQRNEEGNMMVMESKKITKPSKAESNV